MNPSAYPFHPDAGKQLERRSDPTQLSRRGDIVPDGRHIPYVYTDQIILAVNAALATRRPLLLRGTPGCGKSSLARDIALALDRDYLEQVITSRTSARDLLWEFDAVARLSDAGIDKARVQDRANYLHPGVLWNAFSPPPAAAPPPVPPPAAAPPVPQPAAAQPAGRGAVVLLDEIDKADPDVPNDLLVPLGDDRFLVTDLAVPRWIRRDREVLVLITTNGERELPPAFLRRCVALSLPDPRDDPKRLEQIAQRHINDFYRAENQRPPLLDVHLLEQLVARARELASGPAARCAGTAEILDALKACLALNIRPQPSGERAGTSDWEQLTQALLHKDPDAVRR